MQVTRLNVGRMVRFQGQPAPPAKSTLMVLRREIQRVAAKDTAFDAGVYEDRKGICPLTGHCAAVANLVQQRYGGTLIRGIVGFELNGQKQQEVHYWNKLKIQQGLRQVEREVDLTGSQYGGDGFHPLDDPAGKVKPVVKTGTLFIANPKVEQKEERNTVTHSPRFDVLSQRTPVL